jgi:hypothetical protein
VRPGAKFCGYCGAPVASTAPEPAPLVGEQYAQAGYPAQSGYPAQAEPQAYVEPQQQYGYAQPLEQPQPYSYSPPVEQQQPYGYAPPAEQPQQYGYAPPVEPQSSVDLAPWPADAPAVVESAGAPRHLDPPTTVESAPSADVWQSSSAEPAPAADDAPVLDDAPVIDDPPVLHDAPTLESVPAIAEDDEIEEDDDIEITVLARRAAAEAPVWGLDLPDGTRIELEADTVVGRRPLMPVGSPEQVRIARLDDPEKLVSRSHALVGPADDHLRVIDLNSANGTRIITDAGDVIECVPGQAQLVQDGWSIQFAELTVGASRQLPQ